MPVCVQDLIITPKSVWERSIKSNLSVCAWEHFGTSTLPVCVQRLLKHLTKFVSNLPVCVWERIVLPSMSICVWDLLLLSSLSVCAWECFGTHTLVCLYVLDCFRLPRYVCVSVFGNAL
jgi:hypothetical protein